MVESDADSETSSVEISVVQALKDGYEIIKNFGRWTQGCYARDVDGVSCGQLAPEAVSFCALGVLGHVTNGKCFKATCALQRVSESLFDRTVQEMNDSDKVFRLDAHQNVLRIYEWALDRWKLREPYEAELRKD